MHYKLHTAFLILLLSGKSLKHIVMLLPFQVECSKSASKARPFLLHFKLPETRCKKNASTNGGDASRVGIIKRKDTSYTK